MTRTRRKPNPTTERLRQQRLRDRRKEQGWKRVTLWLTPDEADALATLGDEWPWPYSTLPLLADAVAEGKKKVAQVIEEAPELKPTGRPKDREKATKQVPLSKGGNDRLAGCLKRDHPDIASKVQSGEYRSIRAGNPSGPDPGL